MSFTIHGDINELQRLLDGLRYVPDGLATATMRAMNKTITGAKTDAKRMVSRDYHMTQKQVAQTLRVKKASKSILEASLVGGGTPGVPLIRFRRGTTSVPSTRRTKSGGYTPKIGMKVKVRKDRAAKPIKGAFVSMMPSGHVGMFRRAADGRVGMRSRRTAIEELFGPSPIKILAGDRYDEELEDKIDARWQKNIRHQADFILKKAGLR